MLPLKDTWSYALSVLARFRLFLGGGSTLVVILIVYEHYFGGSVHWRAYSWIIIACLFIALFGHGLEQFEKLKPKLYFASGVLEQKWADSRGDYVAYYIEVGNESEATSVHRVTVRLARTDPIVKNLDWLPVPLHIKHDNDPPYATEFSLNPKEKRHIDLVSAPVGASSINVLHVVQKVNNSMPAGEYKLTVIATGEDLPPCQKTFRVWFDQMGVLQCTALNLVSRR